MQSASLRSPSKHPFGGALVVGTDAGCLLLLLSACRRLLAAHQDTGHFGRRAEAVQLRNTADTIRGHEMNMVLLGCSIAETYI